MSLPTTLQKTAAPRRKKTPLVGEAPPTPFRDLAPIATSESLPPAKRREYYREAKREPVAPRAPVTLQLANRCGVNIYPHYRDWQAACHSRTAPTHGCACTGGDS